MCQQRIGCLIKAASKKSSPRFDTRPDLIFSPDA